MKNLIKYIFNTITRNLLRFFSTFNAGRYLIELIQNNIMNLRKKLVHNNIELTFFTPNRICYYRAETFASKEPIITFETPFFSPLKQLLTFGIIPLEIIPFDFRLSKDCLRGDIIFLACVRHAQRFVVAQEV